MSTRKALDSGLMNAFSAFFPLYYTLAFYNGYSPFYYYPLVGEFHLQTQLTTLGPPMAFYGWVSVSTVAAAATALVLPAALRNAMWPGWLWVGPLLATLFTFVYESRWLVSGTLV